MESSVPKTSWQKLLNDAWNVFRQYQTDIASFFFAESKIIQSIDGKCVAGDNSWLA